MVCPYNKTSYPASRRAPTRSSSYLGGESGNLRRIAEAGCYLEWDLFGRVGSFYFANRDIDMPSDAQRMDDIAWVSSQGYGRRVLVAHDICTKSELERYGGHGYGYIVDFIAPQMRDRGSSQQAVDDILVNNPAAALTFS